MPIMQERERVARIKELIQKLKPGFEQLDAESNTLKDLVTQRDARLRVYNEATSRTRKAEQAAIVANRPLGQDKEFDAATKEEEKAKNAWNDANRAIVHEMLSAAANNANLPGEQMELGTLIGDELASGGPIAVALAIGQDSGGVATHGLTIYDPTSGNMVNIGDLPTSAQPPGATPGTGGTPSTPGR